MSTLTCGSIVTQSPAILQAWMHGQLVALNIDKGTYYGLNDTGSRIWALMEQPARVSSICDALVAQFEVDRDVCEAQVLTLLADLRSEGMVEIL